MTFENYASLCIVPSLGLGHLQQETKIAFSVMSSLIFLDLVSSHQAQLNLFVHYKKIIK